MKQPAQIVTLLAVATAALLFAVNIPSKLEAASAKDLKTAPAWELKDTDGKAVKSSDFKGKVVLLDFWATWCPPCREEIPGFVELQKKYGKEGLVIVGISLDEQGPKVVKPFMKKYAINYPVVMGDSKTGELFGGVEAIPTTFVIDRDGKIVKKHVGLAAKSTFESEIKALLK